MLYLDLDSASVDHLEIDGRQRRGHEEGDLVVLGDDGQLVGSDLVGRVTVLNRRAQTLTLWAHRKKGAGAHPLAAMRSAPTMTA